MVTLSKEEVKKYFSSNYDEIVIDTLYCCLYLCRVQIFWNWNWNRRRVGRSRTWKYWSNSL